MSWFRPSSLLDKVFEGSLILKGASAALELIGALLLLTVSSHTATNLAQTLTQSELLEDPHDLVASTLFHTTQSLWGSQHVFAVAFLVIHAAVKFVIVFGLLRNLRWAYPFSFITLALMIAYQIYELVVHFSFGMLFLTLFDFFIMWLIWREYQKLQASVSVQPPNS